MRISDIIFTAAVAQAATLPIGIFLTFQDTSERLLTKIQQNEDKKAAMLTPLKEMDLLDHQMLLCWD
jgi:hypothetical protein